TTSKQRTSNRRPSLPKKDIKNKDEYRISHDIEDKDLEHFEQAWELGQKLFDSTLAKYRLTFADWASFANRTTPLFEKIVAPGQGGVSDLQVQTEELIFGWFRCGFRLLAFSCGNFETQIRSV